MVMNEKSIDSSTDTFLVILLPLAFVIVFLFATWPVLLGLIVLSISFKVWQQRRWQQWSLQVNPIFHQLIQATQGRVTSLDLAMKANISAATAKKYLDTKAEEFGASRQNYEDCGTVYYFITSSILGNILDQSEPPIESEQQENQVLKQIAVQTLDEELKNESESIQVIAPQAETSSEHSSIEPPAIAPEDSSIEPPAVASEALADSSIEPPAVASEPSEDISQHVEPLNHTKSVPQSLIQSELAKRLNVYSSTVYKRRDDPDFSQWSRSKDPDGIAWKFSRKTKEFQPVEEASKEV
jgi:hypothetical protein